VGLWITTLGVIFLLDQQGIVPAHVSFQFVWPAILIVAGLAIVFSTHTASRFWGVILLAWGAVSLSNELGFFHVRIGSLWPVFLIAAGLWMLFHSPGRLGHGPGWQDWHDHVVRPPAQAATDSVSATGGAAQMGAQAGAQFGTQAGTQSGFSPDYSASDDSTFDQSVILSGFKRRITSQHFKFAKISAVLGGFHLDLSRADIDGNQAVIHVDTVFGGGEIRVPDTWKIKIEATAVAGAFVDETYPRPDAPTPGKLLIVRGAAIFGGVNIKN
jgi:hypothetical protein